MGYVVDGGWVVFVLCALEGPECCVGVEVVVEINNIRIEMKGSIR